MFPRRTKGRWHSLAKLNFRMKGANSQVLDSVQSINVPYSVWEARGIVLLALIFTGGIWDTMV